MLWFGACVLSLIPCKFSLFKAVALVSAARQRPSRLTEQLMSSSTLHPSEGDVLHDAGVL